MHALLCRLHLSDPRADRSLADGAEDAPLLDGRPRALKPGATAPVEQACTPAHEEALRRLGDIATALGGPSGADSVGRRSRANPSGLLDPEMLARLGDLLEIRHTAPRLMTRIERNERSRHIAQDAVLLLKHVVSQGVLRSQEVLAALTAPHGGRAPFLLRLASAAVHDVRLSMAMCDLLTELGQAVGRPRLTETLLTLDSPTGARTDAELPYGMNAKYTSFLGRLIGDGEGEWGNDGAVHAIGRLHDEGLLPDRAQVTQWRSRQRWEKQAQCVKLCNDLRQRPPWQPPAHPALSLTALSARLAALLGELSGPSRADPARRGEPRAAEYGACCDEAVRGCVEQALSQGWRQARDRHGDLIREQVSLPSLDLGGPAPGADSRELCLPALGRLPKAPPVRVVDQVLAGVLRDEALRRPLADAASSGVSDAWRGQVAAVARKHVERALDLGDRLAEFLPADQVACYRVRLPADGDGARPGAGQNRAVVD